MGSSNSFLKALIVGMLLLSAILSDVKSKNVPMVDNRLKMATSIDTSDAIEDSADEVLVIPLGLDILVLGKLENVSGHTLTVEDPVSSQKTLLYYQIPGEEESFIFLNPSIQDPAGEIVKPPADTIALNNREGRKITESLFAHIMDKCFQQGVYQVAFAYDTVRSEPARFRICFVKQSVLPLLSVLENSSLGLHVRQEALSYLKQVRPGFDYAIGGKKSENGRKIAEFKAWWESNKDTAEVDALFGQ